MSDSVLQLDGVSRHFDTVLVLHSLSLEIARGEFVAVVGPSGCGKTTLLNLLSGYDTPTDGKVTCSGTMRMVYQHGSLFPWKTTQENILIGLHHLKDEAARQHQLQKMLVLIGLEDFADHYPHQLSGGMRQRAELARALAGEAELLMLDEPFSSLDYMTRLRMRRELGRILEERPRTVVLVTHDIEEAVQLADRVVVLSERPAQIRRELHISLPRPRALTHPEVVQAIHDVLAALGLEGAGMEQSGTQIGNES